MQAPRLVFVTVLALLVCTAGCRERSSDQPAATGEHYSSRGKIIALSPDQAQIQHERIPAIRAFDGTVKPMESMTMPFARSEASFAGIAVGDLVSFEFTVHYETGPTLRLVRITKLPSEAVLNLP